MLDTKQPEIIKSWKYKTRRVTGCLELKIAGKSPLKPAPLPAFTSRKQKQKAKQTKKTNPQTNTPKKPTPNPVVTWKAKDRFHDILS